MRKSKLKFIAPVAMSLLLASCGGATSSNATSADGSSLGEALLGTLAQNVVNGNQTGQALNTAINAGSTISGLIGQLTNSMNSSASIVGTWTYTQPTIQFDSENLLAKAGGTLASQAIVNKIDPYYKKLGISQGVISFAFNKDNTCTYSFKGKQYQGTYIYDNKTHVLTVTSSLGINIINAYATISTSEMAISFDTSKLLTFLQAASTLSSNSTLSTISTLSKSYNGMKTGFLFVRK